MIRSGCGDNNTDGTGCFYEDNNVVRRKRKPHGNQAASMTV